MLRKFLFPKLAEVVEATHVELKAEQGHNFPHARRVANVAYRLIEAEIASPSGSIYSDLDILKQLGWASGTCHNADHLLRKKLDRRPTIGEISEMVLGWLEAAENILWENKESILGAVLQHGKPNDPADNLTTIALKDADRIVNLDPDTIVRSGQWQPNLPPFDDYLPQLLRGGPQRGKYNHRLTIAEDLWNCLEWAEEGPFGVRLPEAKRMIKRRTAFFRQFYSELFESLVEEGIFE